MSGKSGTVRNGQTWVPLTKEELDELRLIKENWVRPSKDERYRIARLAKLVRGVYSAEQQTLHFIAEAQTMERGVCSQSLTRHAADYGYNTRSLQWGLHGKTRKGKSEYPGMLARGLVFLTGGYAKGGRAPGGEGLTPDYAVNLKWLLRYIPEGGDPESDGSPESPNPPKMGETKGETLGETKGETYQKKGETLGDLIRTSSLSSSLTPVPTVQRAARDSVGGSERGSSNPYDGVESDRCSGGTGQTNLVDVDGKTLFQSPAAGTRFVHPGTPSVSPSSSTSSAGNANAPASAMSSAEESLVVPEVGEGNPEDRADRLIASIHQRQLDRQASVPEIYQDFKAVFDRLTRERKIYLEWTPPKEAHKKKAAEFYRAVGRDIALQAWERFLVDGEHDVPQKGVNEETGETVTFLEQRTWLLLCFVNEQTIQTE